MEEPTNIKRMGIKTRAWSGRGGVRFAGRNKLQLRFHQQLFAFFSCQLGKTKVELNEANEEAPHLALLV